MFGYFGKLQVFQEEAKSFQNALDEVYDSILGYWRDPVQNAFEKLVMESSFMEHPWALCGLGCITTLGRSENASRITTAPMFYFSDEGCKLFEKRCPTSPPHLSAYIHAMNGFILYAVQPLPMVAVLQYVAHRFQETAFERTLIANKILNSLEKDKLKSRQQILSDAAALMIGTQTDGMLESNILELDRRALSFLGFDVAKYPRRDKRMASVFVFSHPHLTARLLVTTGDIWEGVSVEERLELTSKWQESLYGESNRDEFFLAQLEYLDTIKKLEITKCNTGVFTV